MLHWMRRHPALVMIVAGLWNFPVAFAIVRVRTEIMNHYGIFGTSWTDRVLAFLDANVPHDRFVWIPLVLVGCGATLIGTGIWKAAAPRERPII